MPQAQYIEHCIFVNRVEVVWMDQFKDYAPNIAEVRDEDNILATGYIFSHQIELHGQFTEEAAIRYGKYYLAQMIQGYFSTGGNR